MEVSQGYVYCDCHPGEQRASVYFSIGDNVPGNTKYHAFLCRETLERGLTILNSLKEKE